MKKVVKFLKKLLKNWDKIAPQKVAYKMIKLPTPITLDYTKDFEQASFSTNKKGITTGTITLASTVCHNFRYKLGDAKPVIKLQGLHRFYNGTYQIDKITYTNNGIGIFLTAQKQPDFVK
jgi:hypothetical protein